MANTKITGLPSATAAANDVLPFVDVSDTTQSPAGTTKRALVQSILDLAPVQSVNSKTGAAVLNADDISDSGTTKKFATAGQLAKVDWLTVTQGVDLDAIETRVNALDAAVILRGTWDASAGTFPGSGTAQAGDSYIVSVGGTVNSVDFVANDRIVAILDNASTTTYASNWFKLDYTDAVLSVVGLTGAITGPDLKTAIGQFQSADYADKSVLLAKLPDFTAYSALVRASGTNGAPSFQTFGTDTVLGRTGSGNVGGIKLDAAHLNNNAVTNAKMAQMATQTLKGRNTAGTGNAEDLTMANLRSMITTELGSSAWESGGGGTSGATYINKTGATLTKGTPVCIAAFDVASGNPGMAKADSDASGFMPCIGILAADCANDATAIPITYGGEVLALDTSSFLLNDVLYVSTSGTLTNVRPTTGQIQPVALVSRVGSTDGEIIVALREPGNIFIENFKVAVSDEGTALTAGTAKLTFRMPHAFTLTAVRAEVNTAPTGASIIVDVNEGGVSIFSTRLSIDASAKTSVGSAAPAVISDAALNDDAEITVDIDQVGSTVAGKGLKLTFYGYRT